MNNLSSFIRYQRKKQKLTQEELAAKAGVGIRFIRELEQGKETLQLDKVNQVLTLFGFNLSPVKQQLDAYDIFWNYLNKAVKITLTNRILKNGIIIKEITDTKENKISAWKFVSNNNAIKYQQKPNDNLTEIILHNDIQTIEEQ
ncbi:MAG: helix-turn-helix transcriptional regulator [Chitinophagales bacterium]|jgi:y4mF family transcriptional regulator|nr:helix-turn-helix transcriptional regulator [Bacteroidota bacterium]MBP8915167.1 helix-turn-helix transcriptional regulator [Chitinophagales bacterium]MBP9219849.1 helix-turn-helix transcriptional regulator [Chitinophagales bacterium]MBP9794397.1 helix-turn-helix transcriptional regulator [Chitinophagales bacterium]